MENSNRIFVCRCEEITEEEVRLAVRNGAISVDAVKRATRAGMGLCQSKTCYLAIAKIINEEIGRPLSELVPIVNRIPVRPVSCKSLVED